jgi:hypothetical protein
VDPLGLWGFGDPLPQGVVDSVTGFGDAFVIPQLVRAAFDLNGSVDQCSTAYKSGEIAGTVWGLIPAGAESLALAADRTVLNANRYFRIGLGRWGGDMTPRISSPYLRYVTSKHAMAMLISLREFHRYRLWVRLRIRGAVASETQPWKNLSNND